VRKINTSGVISTIAGTGTGGSAGDGGPATSAFVHSPNGIAVDGAGNIFITEFGGHHIRKIDSLGVITTVAGNGVAAFGGDGAPAIWAQLNQPTGIGFDAAGNLLIADRTNHRIRKVGSLTLVDKRRRGQLTGQ
jgi:hypothetical protein